MNVEVVQRRLWEQSQKHREHRESDMPLFPINKYDGRVRNLMDLMHHPTWIAAACARVLKRSRGKAAGVDRVTASEFQRNRRAELEKLRLELKRGTYQPQPLRRVMIPKANGKLRGLGIPCLRDKIVQEAIRMALEPIYEPEFHDSSYGFRPNRNTHHAIFRCQQMMHRGFTRVIEGDVKACFDEISHKAILGCVREKVMDNKFLELIRRLLKAGVSFQGVVRPTEKGVPQGGVATPQTMLHTGPASGAWDKRELPYLVYNSDIFFVDLHTFHQCTNNFSFVDPVERFNASGKLLRELLQVVDHGPKFILFVGTHRELGVLCLKLTQPSFTLSNARFKFFFG